MSKESLKNIFPFRLKNARELRGLTLRKLGNLLNLSHNAIHKYETGQAAPDSLFLIQIAEVLHQPIDFFFRPLTVKLENIDFRKKTKLGKNKVKQIYLEAEDYFERYLFIEESLGIVARTVNPLVTQKINSVVEIEQAVLLLRNHWNIGIDAIPNVLELLEREHFKILLIDADDNFDGFSGWSGDIPIIVLNKNRTADRLRFTALHEVGHLLLKFNSILSDSDREKLCHCFAGAMLIPKDLFWKEFGGVRKNISFGELEKIKQEYGISIAAIMARANNLDFLSKDLYKSFCIRMRQNNWHKIEPGECRINETSNRFYRLVLQAAAKEAVSMTLCATFVGKSIGEFRKEVELIP